GQKLDNRSLDLSEDDDDEELREQLDMHSIIVSSINEEPLFTAEQVTNSHPFKLVYSYELLVIPPYVCVNPNPLQRLLVSAPTKDLKPFYIAILYILLIIYCKEIQVSINNIHLQEWITTL
ncbi:hypothetical protein XENORESO_021409, partial [Xenotaenia resolanae]